MQNIPAGLIPYNHEKYLTGKYIAETRGGFRPDEVIYLKGSKWCIIYAGEDANPCICSADGYWSANKTESTLDLFLRPKMVKKWEVVIVCDDEDKADYLYNQLTDAIVREVEVNEE